MVYLVAHTEETNLFQAAARKWYRSGLMRALAEAVEQGVLEMHGSCNIWFGPMDKKQVQSCVSLRHLPVVLQLTKPHFLSLSEVMS